MFLIIFPSLVPPFLPYIFWPSPLPSPPSGPFAFWYRYLVIFCMYNLLELLPTFDSCLALRWECEISFASCFFFDEVQRWMLHISCYLNQQCHFILNAFPSNTISSATRSICRRHHSSKSRSIQMRNGKTSNTNTIYSPFSTAQVSNHE